MTIPSTISNTPPRVQFTVSAGQMVFPFSFWVVTGADIAVYAGETLQTLGVDYTVDLSPQQGQQGGTLTLLSPLPEGVILTLERNMPFERTAEFQEGGAFKAAVLNLELSKLVAMVQQLKRDVDRKFGLAPTSLAPQAIYLPEPVVGKALVFSPEGALKTSVVDVDGLDAAVTTLQAAATTANTAATAAVEAQNSAEAARDAALAGTGSVYATSEDTAAAPLLEKLAMGPGLGMATTSIAGVQKVEITPSIAPFAAATAGVDNSLLMTPQRTHEHFLANEQQVGVNQTWQDVTANRVLNTTYTNTTPKPIMVNVLSRLVSNGFAVLSVDGVNVAHSGGGLYSGLTWYGTLSAVVPVGATYAVTGGSIISWAELKA